MNENKKIKMISKMIIDANLENFEIDDIISIFKTSGYEFNNKEIEIAKNIVGIEREGQTNNLDDNIEEEKQWISEPPDNCDICGKKIKQYFVDGRTNLDLHAPWGFMCILCHEESMVGLGTGKGQLYYKKEINGKFKWIGLYGFNY